MVYISPLSQDTVLTESLNTNILVSGLIKKITFRFHIDTLASKLRPKIGYLYGIKTTFPMLSRKQITEAVFFSVLDHGDVVYRNASASTLAPLNSIDHSALRFITGDSYSTHHCILYEKVGWAPLTVRRDRLQDSSRFNNGWKNKWMDSRWLLYEEPTCSSGTHTHTFTLTFTHQWHSHQTQI